MSPVRSVGVVIPAHNEERLIGQCLASVERAVHVIATQGLSAHVVIACDDCDDRTAAIVEEMGHEAIVCRARNVGTARARGADVALSRGVDWLAFTDADTFVSPQWIASQLALASDVVCGTVGVEDWTAHAESGDGLRAHFERTYRDVDGHRHIHGANLGISARAYRSVGGFENLANSEDVAIVGALEAGGARIAWSALPRVVTSARRDFRATAGFGATLIAVASTIVACATHSAALSGPDALQSV
jgi:glycosyltransferase involved in cell wall biosynthesis